MPRYKKKKHNRLLSPPKKRIKAPKKSAEREEIIMEPFKKPKATPKKPNEMHVIRGKKQERVKKIKASVLAVIIIVIAVMLLEFIFPAGIIQTVSNITAVAGTGSYPIEVNGAQTLNVSSFSNYYFHLTSTYISAYSGAGKELFAVSHGFENPILSVSSGRALVYGQGAKQVHILDLNGIRDTVETKNEIICASIADCGSFAVATYSDSYASQVTVYNKRLKNVFEWYCAEDTINNVAISPNGRKIAVSTFNSNTGVFNSKVNVIGFDSATPEYFVSYDKTLIYGLRGSNNGGFFVIKSKGTDFLRWSKNEKTDYSNEYSISLFRTCGSKEIGVFTRENDKTDNKIIIFSNRGKVKYTTPHKGIIKDIQVKGSNIYILSDTEVSVLDFEGGLKFAENYGFGGNGIVVTSANTVAVVKDDEIIKIKLNEKD